MNWEAIAGASSAMAAVAAAFATWLAFRTLKLGEASRRAEKQSHYFRVMLVEPGTKALQSFQESMEVPLIAFQEVATQFPGEAMGEEWRVGQARQTIKLFNDGYFRLHFLMTTGARAWKDEAVSTAISRALERLQDDVTKAIDTSSRGEDAGDPMALFKGGVAAVYAVFVEADPVLQESETWRLKLRSWLRIMKSDTWLRMLERLHGVRNRIRRNGGQE